MRTFGLLVVICVSGAVLQATDLALAERYDDQGVMTPEYHGPSPEHPHGRLNPDAPTETAQFAFMIGEFDCVDRQLQRDGTWQVGHGEWNASYTMDGYAILDQFRIYETGFATSNMRIYDVREGNWAITWFKMPGYATVTARGEKDDDMMIMSRGDQSNGQKYVFYDISEDGYKWRLENYRDGEMTITWETACTRRD